MVATINICISMSVNHSISGSEAQKLSIINKIGIAAFVVGCIGLIELIAAVVLDKQVYKVTQVENHQEYVFGSFGLMLVGIFLFTFKWQKRAFVTDFLKTSNLVQRIGLAVGAAGTGILITAWLGVIFEDPTLFLWMSMVLMASGILIYTYGTYAGHTKGIKNNHVWTNGLSNRGVLGWIAGVALTLFYIQLYWFSDSLEGLVRLFDPLSYLLTDAKASQWFVYGTLYTFLIIFLGIKFIVKYRHNRYQIIRTISVIFFQLVFAYSLPYILEAFNDSPGYFQKDLKNVWPLNYGFSDPNQLKAMSNAGVSGTFFFFWGLILFLVITPVLTYLVGKRWYCSWVCGCGGLAETAGDSFRQLSSKKESSWRIERWVIHSVMIFVVMMTIGALWPYFSGKEYEIGFISVTGGSFYAFCMVLLLGVAVLFLFGARKFKNNVLLFGALVLAILAGVFTYVYLNHSESNKIKEVFHLSKEYYYWLAIPLLAASIFLFWTHRNLKNKTLLIGAIVILAITGVLTYAHFYGTQEIFSLNSKSLKSVYGFIVGAAFAGVIGVGFYPILGNRVWCRFGCPMAGYMGIFQRFKSRFRITTNGAQCISCGNCSTYCEQGIDVRAYAQKGENIVRASCVGCGVCSAVCPRGVLKLENGPEKGRFEPNPLVVTKDGVKLNP